MKIKVALITTDNRGQWQRFDLDAPVFGPAPEALLSGLAALPELEVHVISCLRQPVRSPEKLAENIWYHSLHVPQLGWMRSGYLGCLAAVRGRLKRIQPDLVHGQGSELEAALCAALSGYPNVITLLGIMREMARVLNARPGSFHWFASLFESLALRRTTGVLCNSAYTEAMVRERTPRTWLVPNAVRTDFLETPLSEPDRGKCILLNVGAVNAYKRQNELLDVAGQLHAEGLDFELQFIGGASRASAYGTQFLDRIHNRPFLKYGGVQGCAELIAAYDRGSALVHVSKIESFGLVVAEALSRNLKFIGFDCGGVADIANGTELAELVPNNNWEQLRCAISRWIKAGAPRPVSAARTMKERYHPVEIARQHLQIYREVLQHPIQ